MGHLEAKMAEKRQAILRSGERLFSTRRYDEITMESIAQSAGVGKGTLYRYFPSKEELLRSILDNGHEELVSSLRSICASAGVFQDLFMEVCRCLVSFQERHHPMYHVLIMLSQRRSGPRRCSSFMSKHLDLLAVLSEFMGRGCSEGLFREGLSSVALASFLLDLMRGWMHSRSCVPGYDVSLETLLEFFRKGALR